MRLPLQEFGGAQALNVADAVLASNAFNLVKLGELLGCPCNNRCTCLQDRKIKAVLDCHVLFVARLNAGEFETARRSIEACMEDCAVAFAGPCKDVRRLLKKSNTGSLEGEPTRDCATDHSTTDHDDIKQI